MTILPRFDNRAIPIVLSAAAIDVIGFGIIMPVLPALITQLGHVDLPEATRLSGWMMTVFAVAQFFAGPVLGNLGDRFGRRPVLMLAMAAFALNCAVMAVAPNLAWLFICRAICGVAAPHFVPNLSLKGGLQPKEGTSADEGVARYVHDCAGRR